MNCKMQYRSTQLPGTHETMLRPMVADGAANRTLRAGEKINACFLPAPTAAAFNAITIPITDVWGNPVYRAFPA